jgi:hypothetical protein
MKKLLAALTLILLIMSGVIGQEQLPPLIQIAPTEPLVRVCQMEEVCECFLDAETKQFVCVITWQEVCQ